MIWDIILFENDRGERPVEEFIKPLSSSSRSKVIHMIRLLKQFGTFLNMPHAKKITKEIYELRVRGKEEIKLAEQRLKNIDKI